MERRIPGNGRSRQTIDDRRLAVAGVDPHHLVPGLAIAARHGVPSAVVDHRLYASRVAFDEALAAEIDAHRPTIVVLAGFMRVLGPAFVHHYAGRLINIHPRCYPPFPAYGRASRRPPACGPRRRRALVTGRLIPARSSRRPRCPSDRMMMRRPLRRVCSRRASTLASSAAAGDRRTRPTDSDRVIVAVQRPATWR